MDDMLFSNMTLNPAAAPHRRAFLRAGDGMGRAADKLAVHARADDRHRRERHHEGPTIGNLGMSEVRFPAPLFEGDTVIAERGRGQAGIEVAAERRYRRIPSPGVPAGGRCSSPNVAARRSCAAPERLISPPCVRFFSYPPTPPASSKRGCAAGADALILDLEDSVAASEKAAARGRRPPRERGAARGGPPSPSSCASMR